MSFRDGKFSASLKSVPQFMSPHLTHQAQSFNSLTPIELHWFCRISTRKLNDAIKSTLKLCAESPTTTNARSFCSPIHCHLIRLFTCCTPQKKDILLLSRRKKISSALFNFSQLGKDGKWEKFDNYYPVLDLCFVKVAIGRIEVIIRKQKKVVNVRLKKERLSNIDYQFAGDYYQMKFN